tara:strand:+ start:5028 stop:5321 length:294 start_codon:yes stop_codon:yes gene_type:complete
MDANHLLYLVRACQLFVAGHRETLASGMEQIRAKTLFIPSSSDLLLMPYLSTSAYSALKDMNKDTFIDELHGDLGHLEGVTGIHAQAERIRAFLESE